MNMDIRPHNDKGQPHGLWEKYWMDGNMAWYGYFHNGSRIGCWEEHRYNGGHKILKTYIIR